MLNLQVISTIFLIVALIFIIINILIYALLFKKANEPIWKVFIPLYNFIVLFKILNKPWWIIFIPFVNTIYLMLIPYFIGNYIKANKMISILSIFIPLVLLPSLLKKEENRNIPTNGSAEVKNILLSEEIDKMENNLVNQNNNTVNHFEETFTYNNIPEENKKEEIDTFLVDNEFKNIEDNEVTFTLNDIERIADEPSFNPEFVNNSDASDVIQEVKKDAVAVAFGGMSQESVISTAKNNNLVCSRCGASLVGASSYCPGCGMQL